MNIRFILLTVIIFLGACSDGGNSDSGSGSASSNKENVIVVIGDSIGAGVGSSINFPDVIASITGIPVINDSSPGISAEGAISAAQSLIAQNNPKYIVSLVGTNNALGAGNQVSGAINSQKLLASLCIENGIICILGTLPHITLSARINSNAEAISAGIRAIEGVRIADIRAAMNGSHTGPDGIHPNEAGHQVMGQVFAGLIN